MNVKNSLKAQQGVIHYIGLIGLAAIGIIVFLLVSSSFPLKDRLFANLFTKTSSQAAGPTTTFFKVGPGFTDGTPHQLVRASNDKVYMFGGLPNFSTQLKAYWTPNPGLPTVASNFSGSAIFTDPVPKSIITVETAYDGANIIHVLYLNDQGDIRDVPFDTSTNSFKSPIVVSTGNSHNGSIGTEGISAMFDTTGKLHLAYWSGGNHISHQAVTYNSTNNTLTTVEGPTQLDTNTTSFSAHPGLAVSPVDNKVVVTWMNGLNTGGTMYARAKASGGSWGAVETASTPGLVWTSDSNGIDIDQGPSIIIDSSGVAHALYIENWDATGSYGHVHEAVRSTSGVWTDTPIPQTYSHVPLWATTSDGTLYMLGHGHPKNSACLSETDQCIKKRNSDGSWGVSQLFISQQGLDGFDSSCSTKYSVVGNNRPDIIECNLFGTNNGSYQDTYLWYVRYDPAATGSTPTPTPNGPTNTPTPTLTPAPVGTVSYLVTLSPDDADQDGTNFSTANTTLSLGTGGTVGGGYVGMRFNSINIPRGATIQSAHLEIVAPNDEWSQLDMDIYADNTGNSQTFSDTSRPSQRPATTHKVASSTNSNWLANVYTPLDEIASVVQEIINRSDWTAGNSLSIITHGTGGQFVRKLIRSVDASNTFAPKLVITYSTSGGGTTPTPTLTPTPTPSVSDTISPTVSITSPLNGSTVGKNTRITIQATASDNVGVTRVEFYVNNTLLCTVNNTPYSCSWKVPGTKNIQYTLTAKAFDAAGNPPGISIISVTSR